MHPAVIVVATITQRACMSKRVCSARETCSNLFFSSLEMKWGIYEEFGLGRGFLHTLAKNTESMCIQFEAVI